MILRTVISFTPFMVCLFWFAVFALGYREHNPAKRVLTWFLLTCSALYFCHALFFTSGPHRPAECLWTLCSLSVYPIYYLYIRALTSDISGDIRQYSVLLPGLIVFAVTAVWPGDAADLARMLLLTVQIALVCLSGISKLKRFDGLVTSCYADVEGRRMKDVRILLFALVLTSAFSACANFLGKTFFAGDDMLLLAAATVFSVMLFTLSYIGYTKDFSFKELSDENHESVTAVRTKGSDEEILQAFDALMKEEKAYLKNGLKITDVASRIGSCRTYVSNCINRTKGEPFSDYINRLRIEDAKSILSSDADIKNVALAEQLGFSNEQSFYRNFRKFTGMTPSQWKNTH